MGGGPGPGHDPGMRAVALALALAATACTVPLVCGSDDVLYLSGLYVTIDGADPDVVYTIRVEAEGAELAIPVGPGTERDPARAELSDGRFLMVYGQGVRDLTVEPEGYFLEVTIEVRDHDARDDWGGPATATITVLDGATPLATATFAPDYARTEPDGPSCPAYEYAEASMSL